MPQNQYITDEQFCRVLKVLNLEIGADEQDDLLLRATGDFEADMADKFVVPLVTKDGSDYSACPEFARNKVLNTIQAKIRQLIGYDKNRNVVIESTERFIDTHGMEYKANIKVFHQDNINFGFKILNQAQDAREEIQSLALSRSNNEFDDGGPW